MRPQARRQDVSTGVSRGLPTGFRRACGISATAPPVRFGEVVWPGRFSAESKHERESQWAFQVFLSVKNRPRFLSKLESGPIPLNIALLRVYLILAQITVYYTLYIYAATEQLYILAIFPTDNHRFQNSINNDENYLLS